MYSTNTSIPILGITMEPNPLPAIEWTTLIQQDSSSISDQWNLTLTLHSLSTYTSSVSGPITVAVWQPYILFFLWIFWVLKLTSLGIASKVFWYIGISFSLLKVLLIINIWIALRSESIWLIVCFTDNKKNSPLWLSVVEPLNVIIAPEYISGL